jgi:hypothetical protein
VGSVLLLLDARVDPVGTLPWGALILLLVIAFALAVGFVGGLVALLIWLRRRKTKDAEVSS